MSGPEVSHASTAEPGVPVGTPRASNLATRVKTLVQGHSELFLVIGILLVVTAVFHWIPHKTAFLNFFYLPVLAAGYLLGARRAMLTSVLCVLLIFIYYIWNWTGAWLAQGHGWDTVLIAVAAQWDAVLSLSMWGGFLILAGTAFGYAHERMVHSITHVRGLNTELQEQAGELRKVNEALQASTTELKRQANELQEKHLLIRQLKDQLEETLFSTMDSTVARLSIQGRLVEEKRNLTVLFCDLKGFTAYSQARHPELILQDLNRFYQAMEERIEGYHGHVDKYLGDGVMSEFGAPIDSEQHSLQAVVAAIKMQEKAREMGLPWPLRVGLASGEAIVGLLGSRRRSYSALGEVVNLAKRLEEICEPGSVYIDAQCYEAVKPYVNAERVRSLGTRRAADSEALEAIAAKRQLLQSNADNPALLFEIGKLYFQIQEASKALEYFRRALDLKPDDKDIKVAYVDAMVKRDEYEKISIRGMQQKQAVFRAVSLMNPLLNRDRFPQDFFDRYQHVQGLIEIPEENVLPVEVIDGAVGHSLAVAVVSYALADQMGLPEDFKRTVLQAARLQDLGKSAVWHHILNRRGRLSEQESKEVEGHVQESISTAKRMGYDKPQLIEIIANHHERLNGTGYPRRAKENEIPMGGRITAVADVYCALTALRPYRDPWDSGVALNELRKGAAAHKFDAAVVESLCLLMGGDTSEPLGSPQSSQSAG